jgi:hypothetical protein
MTARTLKSYRQVWLRNGDEYLYECGWADGSVTMEVSLPWGRLGDAVELP